MAMRQMLVAAAAAFLTATMMAAGPPAAAATTAPNCDRACLNGFADRYLAALAKHSPKGLPLAPGVKFTENTARIKIGEGLWLGASDISSTFNVRVADPSTNQIGAFVVMKESGRQVILAVRLKVAGGKITEIEQFVDRNVPAASASNLVTPRPRLLTTLAPAERRSRAQMVKIVNSYFESIEQGNGSLAPFTDDCDRREDGRQSTHNVTRIEDSIRGFEANSQNARVWRQILAMGCKDQIDTQVLRHINQINPRTIVAIDEARGLAFVLPVFIHRGDIQTVHLKLIPGEDEFATPTLPGDTHGVEIFKIEGGKISMVEAAGVSMPFGSKTGWETSKAR
ncbi:MAG: hypothetical protein ABIO39_10295 [Caulobacteraceae bacterium]